MLHMPMLWNGICKHLFGDVKLCASEGFANVMFGGLTTLGCMRVYYTYVCMYITLHNIIPGLSPLTVSLSDFPQKLL